MAIHDNQRFGLAIGGHIGKVNDRLASVSGGGVEQGKSFAVQNVTTIDISREAWGGYFGAVKQAGGVIHDYVALRYRVALRSFHKGFPYGGF